MIDRAPKVRANSIRLKRSQHTGPFLLVEGQDDKLFMSKFACLTTCKIEVMDNKSNVQNVVRILNDEGYPGILGLADADFDRIFDMGEDLAGIVMHDHHDLETMMLRSPALEFVLREYGSEPKIDKFPGDVLGAVMERALLVGYLRVYSAISDLGLTFRGMDYGAWLERSNFKPNVERLIQHVKNRSNRQDLSTSMLQNGIADVQGRNYDPLEVVTGDDLIGVLIVGLRGVLGNQTAQSVKSEDIRLVLRLSYSEEQFRVSDLHSSIREWETRNPRFQVLQSSGV